MAGGYIDSLFENLHRAEIERKDKLDSQDGLLVGAISVVGGVAIYWSRLIPDDYLWTLVANFVAAIVVGPIVCDVRAGFSSIRAICLAMSAGLVVRFGQHFIGGVAIDLWSLVFTSLTATCAGFFVPALISLLASVWRRNVSLTATPEQIRGFERRTHEYHDWYHKDNEAESDARTEKDVQDFMRDQFVRCAEVNRASNLLKAHWQMRCRCLLVFSVVFAIGNAVPTAIIQRRQLSVQKVEITDYPGAAKPTPQVDTGRSK